MSVDDGRRTDSKGRTVDFKNTVIVMTSNAGSQYIHEYQQSTKSPAQEEEMKRNVEAELHRQFRPESLNRIDDVIIFHALTLEQIKQIVETQLRRLGRMVEQRDLHIEVSDAAKEALAREGFDPAFGARPLTRALQKLVIDPLAIRILEGQFVPGDTVFVNAERDGRVELSKEPEAATVN